MRCVMDLYTGEPGTEEIVNKIIDKSNITKSHQIHYLQSLLLDELVEECNVTSYEDKEYIDHWIQEDLQAWLSESLIQTHDFIKAEFESKKKTQLKNNNYRCL